jgi:type I restriction enzyme S subunit
MKKGWQTRKLGDVCSFLNRGVPPIYVEEGGVVVLNQKCVRDHSVNFAPARRHDTAAKKVAAEKLVRAGDVIVNSTGTGTLGRVAQLRIDPPEATTVDTHVTIVRPKPGMFFDEFFGYMMRDIEDAIKDSGEGASGQTELSRTTLAEKFTVRFPDSKSEQQRIVRILDDAFEGIAAARFNAEKNLANARAVFEGYVQSAFNDAAASCGSKHLEDLAEFKNGLNFSQGSKGQSVEIVGVGDFQDNDVVPLSNLSSITIDGALAAGYELREGDLLTVRSNGSKDLVGRCMIVPELSGVLSYSGFIIRIRPDSRMVLPRFLLYFMKSGATRSRLTRDGGGANISNINQGKLSALEVPIPSLSEQRSMVEKLDRVREETQALEAIASRKATGLDALKQSLLREAFNGRL